MARDCRDLASAVVVSPLALEGALPAVDAQAVLKAVANRSEFLDTPDWDDLLGSVPRRGRAAAGVVDALARTQHGLLADHARAAHLLEVAVAVDDPPVARSCRWRASCSLLW
jgi:hypothetical protein